MNRALLWPHLKTALLSLVVLLAAITRLAAQNTWTNSSAGAWGNAVNWSPNGIPNATNAVVTLTNNVTAYTTNTTENGPGPFPYVFGTLNCNYSGTTAVGGTPSGAASSAQLRAAVSSGTPVINVAGGGYVFFYSVLSGSQGFNKSGPGSLTFRYNSFPQPFSGNVTVSAGTLELQQDTSLGNSANSVTIAGGATLSARASINNQTVTLPVTRNIFLNAAGSSAQLGTASAGFTNIIQGVIAESAAGSGLTTTGTGTVVLGGVNTYTGPTTISAGTLALSGSGSITNSGSLTVNSGATFDVSARAAPFTLGPGQALRAAATGFNPTGQILMSSTAGLVLSAGGLVFTNFGGGATAPLTVNGAGALELNGAPVTITTTSNLAAGNYTLIGTSGSASVTGTPGALTINGSGTAAASGLFVISGQLVLTVGVVSNPGGPTLSDADLFAALNLNYPGLEQVKLYANAANYPAARTNLANYLRSRTNVVWYWDPYKITNNISFDQTTANNAVTGKVNVVNVYYTFPDTNIDWLYNVTTDPNFNYTPNNEWQWQLNRMNFWPALGATYWGTGNELYVRAWTNQMESWFEECPVPATKSNGVGSPWRTIEAGIRMGSNWPNTFFRCLASPSFGADALVNYLKSCVEHGRYLRSYPTASGNWVAIEQSGLYTAGVLFPELNESLDWRSYSSQRLYIEQTNMFYPDGAEMELTPSYHNGALGNILNLYTVAAMEGRKGELPANYTANMESAYAFFMWLLAPDGTVPQFNDSIYALNAVPILQTGNAIFTNRTDFIYAATHGASGTPPAQTSYSFPYAGYNVMRSGWGSTANYLCFCAGPLGLFHQHQDGLNLVLWAWGRQILFDSGGGQYTTSLWRNYGISSPSHNTIMVDGKEQIGGDGSAQATDPDYVSQAPRSMRWESSFTHNFAAGIYNRGYGTYTNRPATHHRRVLFIKPDIYLVADTLIPADTASHTYEARWHVLPASTAYNSTTKVVSTIDAGKPNLAIVPCLQSNLTVVAVVGQSNGPSVTQLAGWNIIGSGTAGYTPCTTVKHNLSATGTNQFLTLLLPLATGAASPVSEVVSTGPNSARVDLTDGRKFYVSADPNPAGYVQLIEVLNGGVTNRNISSGLGLPSISDLPDQLIAKNSILGPLTFTVSVSSGYVGSLILSAHATSQSLVPDGNIILGGTGASRTLTLTPAVNGLGATTISLFATTPGGGTMTNSFQLSVINPPAITVTNQGGSAGNLTIIWPANFTGWKLQSQTNQMGAGLTTNWVTIGNSTDTNQITIPVNTGNGSVFYRLSSP